MNRTEFAEFYAKKWNIPAKQAEAEIERFNSSLEDALVAAEDKKISFVNHGTYEIKHREERKGRNPQTKEEITIPASNVVTFKSGKNFKAKIN